MCLPSTSYLATSCTGSCEDVGVDISVDISPPDVLDVTQIGTCASPTVFTCIKDNDLGEFRWDVEQARALLELIQQVKENYGKIMHIGRCV